jgi:hypothetical protein
LGEKLTEGMAAMAAYGPEEQKERASKASRLNGGPGYNPAIERLLAASSTKKKPTFRIKRLGSGKLKAASSLQKEREKAEKALRLNGG